jgi:hypothetical protein
MEEESWGRLMDIVLQMRINLVHITDTFHQQTLEIRQQLGAIFEEEKKALDHCLNGIDDKLKECSVYIEDYKRLYSTLSSMRQKLVQLGAEPSAMPTPSPEDEIEKFVAARLEQLKNQGKV